MHSSGMRSDRFLTISQHAMGREDVYPSMHWVGCVSMHTLGRGNVFKWGWCLPITFVNFVWAVKIGNTYFKLINGNSILEAQFVPYQGLCSKGSFTPSDSVINVTLTDKMGMQPVLPVKVPIKKLKGAAHQCYNDSDGVVRCEQTLRGL